MGEKRQRSREEEENRLPLYPFSPFSLFSFNSMGAVPRRTF
jgi:hypothetical protein